MQLLFSPTSPFVRKCLAVAVEAGLADRLVLTPATAHPVNRSKALIATNPLGQVPTLLADDGLVLYDSRVICEYLDALGQGTLFPAGGKARWEALTLQALADGILDAALLARYEDVARTDGERSAAWRAGQVDKIGTAISSLEPRVAQLEGQVHIGTLTLGCALWYLALRFPDLGWQATSPRLAQWWSEFSKRPSMSRDWSA